MSSKSRTDARSALSALLSARSENAQLSPNMGFISINPADSAESPLHLDMEAGVLAVGRSCFALELVLYAYTTSLMNLHV